MKKLVVILAVLLAPLAFGGAISNWDITVNGSAWTSGDVLLNDIIGFTFRAGDSTDAMGFQDAKVTVSAGTLQTLSALGGSWFAGANVASAGNGAGFDVVLNAIAAGTDPGVAAGVEIYNFTFKADVLGSLTIDALGGKWVNLAYPPAVVGNAGFDANIPYETMNVTPEPMTMALLGLGGLFLRRRRA